MDGEAHNGLSGCTKLNILFAPKKLDKFDKGGWGEGGVPLVLRNQKPAIRTHPQKSNRPRGPHAFRHPVPPQRLESQQQRTGGGKER